MQKKQRNVVLIDDSGCGINLGLWGEICDKVTEANIHSVLAVKGVSVSDFGGKSINVSDEKSQIYTALVNERSSALKRWYSDLKQRGENDILNF